MKCVKYDESIIDRLIFETLVSTIGSERITAFEDMFSNFNSQAEYNDFLVRLEFIFITKDIINEDFAIEHKDCCVNKENYIEKVIIHRFKESFGYEPKNVYRVYDKNSNDLKIQRETTDSLGINLPIDNEGITISESTFGQNLIDFEQAVRKGKKDEEGT